jgi:hypothetical protein
MRKLLTDNEINVLIKSNSNGRFELKEIAQITEQPYCKVVKTYNVAIKKLKSNKKKWNRLMEVMKVYMAVKRHQRESFSKKKK